MELGRAFQIIRELPFDKEVVIFREGSTEIYVKRPSKLTARFKKYNPGRNFQVWLRDKKRNFKPNHLRVLIVES